MFAGPGGYRGEFMAWDPVQRKKVWSIKENMPVWSGALGDCRRRRFLRHDGPLVQSGRRKERQGAVAIPSRFGIIGQPVTYEGATARNTSQSSRASAAGPALSRTRKSILASATPRSASPARCRICRPTRRAAANWSYSHFRNKRRWRAGAAAENRSAGSEALP